MSTAATRREKCSEGGRVLHLAFELGNKHWKLAFTTGLGRKPRERTIEARDLEALRGGDLAGEATLWPGRFGAGGELLRGGSGRVLAAPLVGGGGDRERGGGLLEHRGEPPGAASEVGSAGCAEPGEEAGALTRRGSGRCGAWCGCRRWRRRTAGTCTGSWRRSGGVRAGAAVGGACGASG